MINVRMVFVVMENAAMFLLVMMKKSIILAIN